MKKNILTLVNLLIITLVMSQSPEGFKYQSVVRNGDGNEIADTQVGVRISILEGSDIGTAVCIEEFTPTTNGYGLINLDIGSDNLTDFSNIDWGSNSYFIKIEIDTEGGTSYTHMGTSELLSVPYALHAKTVENFTELDGDPTNEIQDLEVNFDILTITNNGSASNIDLGDYKSDTTLNEAEVDAFVSNNGYLTSETDGSTTNEIQDLQLSNNILTITNKAGPTNINLSPYLNARAQELIVAINGGDAITVSDAIDKLLGQGAYSGVGALSPAPSISNQWIIEVKSGNYTEPGTFGGSGVVVIPNWVTVRGQGWNATELVVTSINMAGTGRALESLLVTCTSGNPVISMNSSYYSYIRECKIEANTPNRVIDMNNSYYCDIIDNFIYILPGATSATGIYIAQVTDCRIENNTIDFRNNLTGCFGIADAGNGFSGTSGVYILENTIIYSTDESASGSVGISVAKSLGSQSGRISFNTFNLGNPSFDIDDSTTPGQQSPSGGPHGICNHNSSGNEITAF